MKWKDTGVENEAHPEGSDPYYEDDGYAASKAKKDTPGMILSGNPVRYLYWGLGLAVVVGVVLVVLLLFSNFNETADATRINQLEARIDQLEKQLAKVDGVDEKVTHIWEQAKAFETFKTRFDRSEASTSLRMDHLAMSLDALQKKIDQTMQAVTHLEKTRAAVPPPATPPPTVEPAQTKTRVKTHTVATGDTLYSISRKYKLTIDQLRSLNALEKGAVIHVGQTLTVSPKGN